MSYVELITILGGWSVVLIAIATFVSKVVSAKIFSEFRKSEQKDIERYKSDLSNTRLLLESNLNSLVSGQSEINKKRTEAIESLWKTLLVFKEKLSGPIFFYTILKPSEYNSQLEYSSVFSASISDINQNYLLEVAKETETVAQLRPFIGEMLWYTFFSYRAFLFRIAGLIEMGKARSNIIDWREDDGVKQIIENTFPQETALKLLNNGQQLYGLQIISQEFEQQILKEIYSMVSGEYSATQSLKNAEKLRCFWVKNENEMSNKTFNRTR